MTPLDNGYLILAKIATTPGLKESAILTNRNFFKLIQELEPNVEVKLLKQDFTYSMQTSYLDKYNALYDPRTKAMSRLFDAGIVQKIIKSYFENKQTKDGPGPAILTMDDLGAGFKIWLACIIVSIAVFLLEFLKPYRIRQSF